MLPIMTPFQKAMIGLTAAILVAIIAAVIVFLVVTRQQEIDANKAECDALYEGGSFAYYYCLEQADN